MSRSSCSGLRKLKAPKELNCYSQQQILVEAIAVVEKYHHPWHLVKYRGLCYDPYAAAAGILTAFPVLESPDPSLNSAVRYGF